MTFNYNPSFPEVKTWGKGGYYVVPIVGNCTMYVPVPEEEEEALDFIDDIESFLLSQENNGGYSVEFTLEPNGDFEK